MYQALYRKYRPRTFDDVVGQKSVTQTLKTQIITGRLSHAYLFTGTRGTGKTSCAKILARAVNCEHPVDGNPCNCCAACRSIENDACMDVQEIDAASNNGVDNVRALRDDAIYTPAEVRRRVYIIDEVHMLSISAFNALLKIIEEPPEHLIFILATTELNKVPATILSRCQRFSFRRLLPEDIAGRLGYVAYQEGIDLEPEAAAILARLADGALRDGLSLLDQCASAADGTLTPDFVYDCLGLAGDRSTYAMLSAIAKQDAASALGLLSRLYDSGKDIRALLDELCAAARDLLILKTAPQSGLSMISGLCTTGEAKELTRSFSKGELIRMVALLQEALAGRDRSANLRVDAELSIVRLCTPALELDANALNARLTRLEERIASGRFQMQAVPEASEESEEEPPFPDDADDPEAEPPKQAQLPADGGLPEGFWPELTQALRTELGVPARGFFSANGPISPTLKGDTLYLRADSFVQKIIAKPEILQLVGQKASALLGRPVQAMMERSGASGADSSGVDKLLAMQDRLGEKMTVK